MEDRRRPGRPKGTPRVDEPRTSVSTWLPASEYDRLNRLAQKHERSISSMVRSLLMLKLPPR
jgi:hypothetical protein